MAFPQKAVSETDSATLALWRAAEEGVLDELIVVLPHVRDINARNEHGVTALMRAAQFGHHEVVRVLLEHGADANITRNDKFTALALAAFFGHTEIVRTLMQNGANREASTRHGTSPHMWAKARTYNDVAGQLKNPAPPKIAQPVAPAARAEVNEAPVHAVPRVVRTLKDPPEIWDLVHEVPKGFNARSAFVSRVTAMQKGWGFRVATVGVLIAVVAIGVLVFRRMPARNEQKAQRVTTPVVTESQVNNAETGEPVAPAPATETRSATETPAATEVAPAIEPSLVQDTTTLPVDRRFNGRSPSYSAHRVKRDTRSQVSTVQDAQPNIAKTEKANTPVRTESATGTKVSAPLSPQLISPAKSGTTTKPKVIQWP
jgi:ankyrin repeat protein